MSWVSRILRLPLWLLGGSCILIGLAGGVAIMVEVAEATGPRVQFIRAGEWVLPDIQLGNAVVHRGRVACPLDDCPAGQYGYWRLWTRADHPNAPWPLYEQGRFGCGCAEEGEAPPPEVFVIEARTFDVPHPGTCGVSATCLGVERLYCREAYRPWCDP